MKNLTFILVVLLFVSMKLSLMGQVGGQMPLLPTSIPQFVDPLPHFAGLRVDASGGNLIISYEPTQQIAVSTGTVLANGTVGTDTGAGKGNYWAYSISNDNGNSFTPALWPGFTVEAHRGVPLNVHYINNLHGQTYEDVNMIVDQTLHWADPEKQHGSFDPYDGPVPVVPHLHGGEVASESDGGPDAWFTPDNNQTGPAWGIDGTDDHYYYPNTQESATLWYHDHSLGVTRLNVYAGLAGFYFLRGQEEEDAMLPGWSGDDLVQEIAPDGTSGVFNPDPYLPEIEMVFQDRMFDTNGELYFPNEPSNETFHPFWTPEFVGNVITVNGKTWPYLSVAQRKYRFRLLNGSNARFYEMTLEGSDWKKNNKIPPHAMGNKVPEIFQIGTDGGLMDSPVPVKNDGTFLLAPGERADIVIDFSKVESGSTWTLLNSAGTPYPYGDKPNPATEGKIMQFVVNGIMVSAKKQNQKGKDKSKVLPKLRSNPMVRLSDFEGGITVQPTVVRQLTLNEVMANDSPLEALVNNTKWDGNGMNNPGLGVTELPVEGETELWQIINLTGDAHPIHLHLVQMQLVSRQTYDDDYHEVYEHAFSSGDFEEAAGPPNDYDVPNADGAVGGNPAVSSYLLGTVKPPLSTERGWKDTYIMYPGEVTTFIVRFAPTDIPANAPASELLFGFDPSEGLGYVWHCHILDHEDNEMMRPYKVQASPFRAEEDLIAADLKSGESKADNLMANITGFSLDQNYPNPFNGDTEISFRIPERMHTRLALLNMNGQTVRILIDQMAPGGNHTVRFNASGLAKGIYLYRLTAGLNVATKRLVVN